MLGRSLVAKLLLALCLGCLAVGLIGGLPRERLRGSLRRLQATWEPADAPEGAEAEAMGEIVEDYGEPGEQLGEDAFVVEEPNTTNETLDGQPTMQLPVLWAGRGDVTGIERCGGGNVGYCNSMMYRARGACPSSGCVLIVNPPGHRTRTPLHIHAYYYNSYGAHVKRSMAAKVCRSGGWQTGGFPCGGRAKFFKGFPPVFSVVGGNPIASVTAWPGSCGGRGTIVLVSYGCSIEHSICQHC